MYLSDEQKQWVRLISEGKIKDVTTFLELHSAWFAESTYNAGPLINSWECVDLKGKNYSIPFHLTQNSKYF